MQLPHDKFYITAKVTQMEILKVSPISLNPRQFPIFLEREVLY